MVRYIKAYPRGYDSIFHHHSPHRKEHHRPAPTISSYCFSLVKVCLYPANLPQFGACQANHPSHSILSSNQNAVHRTCICCYCPYGHCQRSIVDSFEHPNPQTSSTQPSSCSGTKLPTLPSSTSMPAATSLSTSPGMSYLAIQYPTGPASLQQRVPWLRASVQS